MSRSFCLWKRRKTDKYTHQQRKPTWQPRNTQVTLLSTIIDKQSQPDPRMKWAAGKQDKTEWNTISSPWKKEIIKGKQEEIENQMNTPYKQLISILSETGKVWNSYDKNRMLWEKSREDRQAVQRRQGSAQVCQPHDCQGEILTRGGRSVWDGIEEHWQTQAQVNCLPHRKQQQRKLTSEKSKRAEQTENRKKTE